MEGFAQTIEKLFIKDTNFANFLCPSLEPSQFYFYADEFLTVKTLEEVLKLLNIPYYGVKKDKITRLFSYFYPGDCPKIERSDKPSEIQDGNFKKIIQSIMEGKQTPAVPKTFLSFFNRKETTESLKRLINKETIKDLKQFLVLVGCKVGNKDKEDKVNRVLQYLRPSYQIKSEVTKEKETPKKKENKEKAKPKEPKKRKLSGEEKKQTKKIKTEKPGSAPKEQVNIQPEVVPSGGQETSNISKPETVPSDGQNTPKLPSFHDNITTVPGIPTTEKVNIQLETVGKDTPKSPTVYCPTGGQYTLTPPAVGKITKSDERHYGEPVDYVEKREFNRDDNEIWKRFKKLKKKEINIKVKQTDEKKQKIAKIYKEICNLTAEVNAEVESQRDSYKFLKDLKKKYVEHVEHGYPGSFYFGPEYYRLESEKLHTLDTLDLNQ
eukprot:TRINITY_DN2073_c0_g1_i1.p1 TRINITY_DN2073_c0_g1~~TRINITY_DN2073_c0_g1_i1.p1  ORF type:complete len:436 (+),score=122.06 TRINITY_DN2073_c0_g1_i1:30-1337(+)